MATATCKTCNEIKPVSEFRASPKMRAGHRSSCRACDAKKSREYYWANPEQSRKKALQYRSAADPAQLRKHGWSRQGITDLETAERLYQAQALCDLGCGRRGSVVDHDHETGMVRGWLCRTCNRAIARLGDTAERLALVADYMRGAR